MRYLLVMILTIFLVTSCQPQGNNTKTQSKDEASTHSTKTTAHPTNKKVNKDEAATHPNNKKEAYKAKPGLITDETVMAEFNGKKILFKDIKKNYSKELKEAKNKALKEDYDKTSLKVNKFAIEKLLTEEAKKQGLRNHKELLDKITSKIAKPSKKEIDAMKTKYAKQFAAKKMKAEEITKLVKDYIMNQKKSDAAYKYLEKIKKEKGFKISLPYPNIPTLKIAVSDNDPFEGPKDSKYVIVEFSDFQCPYCSRVAPIISGIKKTHKDVKVVFKFFPLSFHKMARKAAYATHCANKQGKFWELHDKIFANQKDLNDINLEKWAAQLKLDMNKYKACLASPETKKAIEDSIKEGIKIGVKGTPSIFLNGTQINVTTPDLMNEAIQTEKDKVVGDLTNDTVIATINNKPLKWSGFLAENRNFDALNKSNNMKRDYELYAKLLSKELSKQILELASKEAGLKSIDEYIKQIISKIKAPEEKELKALYEKLKPRLQGKKYDEIKAQLIKYAKQMKGQNAVQEKMKELSDKYKVKVTMPLPMLPKFDINTKDAAVMGKKDAKYTVVEFSDFQCPYCSKAAKFTEEILKKYPNKVKIVFKNFPLPFHKNAKQAAYAGECARIQGKFREFYNKAFANQDKLSEKSYIDWAKELKLDVEKFKKCLKDPKTANKIDKDLEEGQELGIQGTPTLFLDGTAYNGKHDIESFSKLIR